MQHALERSFLRLRVSSTGGGWRLIAKTPSYLRRFFHTFGSSWTGSSVRDGSYYTAVGGMAGIDLCLYLIENDCGQATFLDVAKMLVIFLRRPGNQPQVSEFLKAQSIRNTQIAHVMDWALDNLTTDLSVDALAKRAAMSPRNFSRAFMDEMMTSLPVSSRASAEAARILLETTPLSIQQIAHRAGFGTRANMRRAFVRAFHAPPAEYRHNIVQPTATSNQTRPLRLNRVTNE